MSRSYHLGPLSWKGSFTIVSSSFPAAAPGPPPPNQPAFQDSVLQIFPLMGHRHLSQAKCSPSLLPALALVRRSSRTPGSLHGLTSRFLLFCAVRYVSGPEDQVCYPGPGRPRLSGPLRWANGTPPAWASDATATRHARRVPHRVRNAPMGPRLTRKFTSPCPAPSSPAYLPAPGPSPGRAPGRERGGEEGNTREHEV